MTISLSKIIGQTELSRREIKIKPIERVKKETTTDNIVEESELLYSKLEQAKNELNQIKDEQQKLLEETKTVIQLEKDNWLTEKQEWMNEAKREGFEAGFKQGELKGIETYQESLAQANNIVDLVKVDYQKTLDRTEDVIIQLGIHTAEKILNQKLNEEPQLFLNIVKTALKEIKDQSVVSIYLHPSNYEEVLLQKEELKRMLEDNTKLSLYINEDLPEFSCVIEHPFGQIDASVDTQLESIRNILNELVMESK